MKRQRPLNPSDLDQGLMEELKKILTDLESNTNNTAPLQRFLEIGRGDQVLQYWSLCGEV
jgi:hypothetical protein